MTNEELTRRFFEDDRFVKLVKAEIVTLSAEKTVVRAPISENCLNANDCVQGGMLYTVADFAFAVHSNYLHPMTVTQGGRIAYIRAARTAYITAVAKETVRSGHNNISEVIVYDDKDEIVCVCNFNGFIKDADRDALKEKYSKK